MRSFPWDSLIIGKNEEYNYPIIDRPSSAEDLRELYKTFFTNGVFLQDENAFQVTPGDGMNVIVAGGKCGIEGTIGYEAAPRGLAIQASSSTADRIDTVVLRWNNNIEVRSIDMYVKTGVAQDVPVRPTLTRSESVWELGIADIFVAKNSGAISSARITDTRLQTDRCGAVTPFATIDTTTFFNQIQAAIDENVATLQEQTQVAVELAKDAIDGTTAGNLQNQITANKEEEDGRWGSLTNNRNIQLEVTAEAILNSSNNWYWSFTEDIDIPDGYRLGGMLGYAIPPHTIAYNVYVWEYDDGRCVAHADLYGFDKVAVTGNVVVIASLIPMERGYRQNDS